MKEKRTLFWKEYAKSGDAHLSALMAGYSRKYANIAAKKFLAEAAPLKESDSVSGPTGQELDDPTVTVDWVVREARRTYDAAHQAGSLSTAVSCLNLIGKHLEGKTGAPAEEASVAVVTGIEGAPGTDADD